MMSTCERPARKTTILDVNESLLRNAFDRIMGGCSGNYGAATVDSDTKCMNCQAASNKGGLTRKLRMSIGNTITTIEVQRGYPRVKLDGAMTYAHHISFVAAHIDKRNNPIFRRDWVDPSLEISHICGNPKCINPEHLLLEPEALNKHRDCCHAFTFLTRCPNCLATIDSCPHIPPCVKRGYNPSVSKPGILVTAPPAPAEEELVRSASQAMIEQELSQEQEAAIAFLGGVYNSSQMELLKAAQTAEELETLAEAAKKGQDIQITEDFGEPESDDQSPEVALPTEAAPSSGGSIVPIPKADAWGIVKAGSYVSGLKRRKH